MLVNSALPERQFHLRTFMAGPVGKLQVSV